MLRVIAGQFRSRRLKTLPGRATRLTSDRLRETLFNVIGARIVGAVVVDAYAGSGAVGIEALSRGASKVFFLENARTAAALIRGNLLSLGVMNGFEILPADVVAGLRQLARREVVADLVFLDPPYAATEEYERALACLGEGVLLGPDSLVVAEHARRLALPERIGRLVRTRTLPQGDSALSFYRLAA